MCDCDSPDTVPHDAPIALPAGTPTIPIASPVSTFTYASDASGFESGDDAGDATPNIGRLPAERVPLDPIVPRLRRCNFRFPNGCWMLTVTQAGSRSLVGTLRVDRGAPASGTDQLIISGDLYRQPLVLDPGLVIPPGSFTIASEPGGSIAGNVSSAVTGELANELTILRRRRIPIYPRARYHSYLKGIRLSVPTFSIGACRVTIDVEQFNYTHPPAGSFLGSFAASASRTLRFVLDSAPDPLAPFNNGPYYTGRMLEGGIDKGVVELVWVSSFMRRAVLEIDTLTGAVRPQPVPHPSGVGTEFFDTVFAQAGWQLTVVQDQTGVPVPAGVNANACWADGALHALMTNVRNAATNLDAEWRTHLVVVPATMGCSRGVMYDQIGVPREGSASFSHDGYPVSNSSNFGTAANQQQRNVPRAFLRSACHEVTHAFNQIHQENETSADNSIMTTTPSVADVLGGPATGAPGVFPDQINLGFNTTVRNHLAHMPDPVVRPGGWPFASWFGGTSPQASDYEEFDAAEVTLDVTVDTVRPALGQPVMVTWTLTNRSTRDFMIPNDISLEGTFATMDVTDSRGRVTPVRAFAIICDDVALLPLEPGASRTASYRAFWSTAGFAFERAGRHKLAVSVAWSAHGVPVFVRGATDVFVDYPLTDADNEAAALAMHPQVGMWVALDGKADHLMEAVARVAALTGDARGDNRASVSRGANDEADLAGSRTARAFSMIASGRPRTTGDDRTVAPASANTGRSGRRGTTGRKSATKSRKATKAGRQR